MQNRAVAFLSLALLVYAAAFDTRAADAEYHVGTVSMDDTGALTFHLMLWDRHEPKPVDLTVSRNNRDYATMLPLAKGVSAGRTEPLPSWPDYLGVVAMSDDGTITYYNRFKTSDAGDAIFKNVFPPGNALGKRYADLVGGLAPGDIKPVPPWPPSIGSATMLADGTIEMLLRAQSDNGTIFEGKQIVRPGDPQYEEIKRHLGGLKTGETKSVPPWPDPK